MLHEEILQPVCDGKEENVDEGSKFATVVKPAATTLETEIACTARM